MNSEIKDGSARAQYISMIICWLAYTCVCIGRFSYSANIILVEKDYGISHASAGLVMTFFSITYGAGQFIHGALCKHYPRRQIVTIALIVVSIINFSLFFNIPFWMIKYLWLLSAAFQSILWPMTMQIISENVGEKLMGKAILLMSTTTSLGTFLVYGFSAVFGGINFRLTFVLTAGILLALAIIWYMLYKPGDFLKIKKSKDDSPARSSGKFIYILVPVILLGFFSLCTNFLKDGIQTWVPNILKSIKKDLPDSTSLLLTLILPLFGVFGSVFAVSINKKIPKVIHLILFFFAFISLFNATVYCFGNNLILTVIVFGLLELFLHSSSIAIVSIFPLIMRRKMGTGAIAGILNGAGYIGSALSGVVLGHIADVSEGWSAVFATLLGVSVGVLLLGGVYLIFTVKHKQLDI